jgi:hypothetical protein
VTLRFRVASPVSITRSYSAQKSGSKKLKKGRSQGIRNFGGPAKKPRSTGPSHVEGMTQLPGKGDLLHEISQRAENPAFQIRSSQAQFLTRERFWRVEKSITCVFSTKLNIPTPPASTILSP